MEKWGSSESAHGKKVSVTYGLCTAIGELQDTLPPTGEIRNGAGIDLNPGFCNALRIAPGGSYDDVYWDWA
nr:hypothetical protein [Dyella sp. ASV24]